MKISQMLFELTEWKVFHKEKPKWKLRVRFSSKESLLVLWELQLAFDALKLFLVQFIVTLNVIKI